MRFGFTSMALNSLIRNSLETEITPSDTPAISQDASVALLNENLSKLQTLACERRPELKSMQLRRDMSSAGVAAAKGGWYPQIFLQQTMIMPSRTSEFFHRKTNRTELGMSA